MAQALENTENTNDITEADTLAAIDRSIECLQRCNHPKRQLLLAVMSEDHKSHNIRLACDTQLIMEVIDSLMKQLKEKQPSAYLILLLNITKQLHNSNGSDD